MIYKVPSAYSLYIRLQTGGMYSFYMRKAGRVCDMTFLMVRTDSSNESRLV